MSATLGLVYCLWEMVNLFLWIYKVWKIQNVFLEEAFQHKKLWYANLAADAEDRDWKIKVHPVEVGRRGFVANTTVQPSGQ